MNMNTTAGRELIDCCQVANPERAAELTFGMATLLCSSMRDRSLVRLRDAGVLLDQTRLSDLSAEDLALLLSDEGLQLWLRFAALPSAYLGLFVDSIMNGASCTEPSAAIACALRVLVLSGRDKTNNVATSEAPGSFHLPLAHLCSQVAPKWLPSLLKFGADANQVSAKNVPLVVTAMAAQADRIHRDGHDLLIPHTSLYQLGTLLRSHGAQLSQHPGEGAPPVSLLALNGYCAAAEALLSAGAQCNTADGRGNTLMHHLAAAVHLKRQSFLSFFMITLALRFGGDLDQPNHDGVAAFSLLPGSVSQYVRMSQKMIALAREAARRSLSLTPSTQPLAPSAESNVPPFVAAMARQARQLHAQGHDLLLPHESLLQLGISFQRRGIDLGQRHPDGTPPVLWLTQRGYCGAAETLLALNPNTNVPAQDGNTLMHALAANVQVGDNAVLADHMLTTALRYGGNPHHPNRSGQTALSLLPDERRRFLRASFTSISATRTIAQRMAASRLQPITQPSDAPMRHSVAPL